MQNLFLFFEMVDKNFESINNSRVFLAAIAKKAVFQISNIFCEDQHSSDVIFGKSVYLEEINYMVLVFS